MFLDNTLPFLQRIEIESISLSADNDKPVTCLFHRADACRCPHNNGKESIARTVPNEATHVF